MLGSQPKQQIDADKKSMELSSGVHFSQIRKRNHLYHILYGSNIVYIFFDEKRLLFMIFAHFWQKVSKVEKTRQNRKVIKPSHNFKKGMEEMSMLKKSNNIYEKYSKKSLHARQST